MGESKRETVAKTKDKGKKCAQKGNGIPRRNPEAQGEGMTTCRNIGKGSPRKRHVRNKKAATRDNRGTFSKKKVRTGGPKKKKPVSGWERKDALRRVKGRKPKQKQICNNPRDRLGGT